MPDPGIFMLAFDVLVKANGNFKRLVRLVQPEIMGTGYLKKLIAKEEMAENGRISWEGPTSFCEDNLRSDLEKSENLDKLRHQGIKELLFKISDLTLKVDGKTKEFKRSRTRYTKPSEMAVANAEEKEMDNLA